MRKFCDIFRVDGRNTQNFTVQGTSVVGDYFSIHSKSTQMHYLGEGGEGGSQC